MNRAAVVPGVGEPWVITDVDVGEPMEGEVRVQWAYAGLCGSDAHLPFFGGETLPLIAGHEGSGIVDALGPGVSRLSIGDHVVASVVPSCGHCRWCSSGRASLCLGTAYQAIGCLPDETFRMTWDGGKAIGAHCSLGTFAERTVVAQDSVVKIDADIPLDIAALISCGVLTGFGMAVNAAKVAPGETILVLGAGGVGMNAIQASAYSGALHLIVVEPNLERHALAREFGATHIVTTIAEGGALAARLNPTAEGADKTLMCIGTISPEIVTSAFEATGKGGSLVITSVTDDLDEITIHLPSTPLVFTERRIIGSQMGSSNPHKDIPMLATLYREGRIRVAELATARYSLDQLNQGFADLKAGRNIRGLVEHGR